MIILEHRITGTCVNNVGWAARSVESSYNHDTCVRAYLSPSDCADVGMGCSGTMGALMRRGSAASDLDPSGRCFSLNERRGG
jgi:hypothetical protein